MKNTVNFRTKHHEEPTFPKSFEWPNYITVEHTRNYETFPLVLRD